MGRAPVKTVAPLVVKELHPASPHITSAISASSCVRIVVVMGKKQRVTGTPTTANGASTSTTTSPRKGTNGSSSNGVAPSKSDISTLVSNGTTTSNGAERGEFLKLFWTLAESDPATRTAAAAQLIAQLQAKKQQQHKTPDSSFADDVQYTLKRLVRGLASSRDAARQGFSAALASLLAAFPEEIALTEVLALLRDAMQVHVGMKGMEQREHMFGRLFGLLAMHRSGRLRTDSISNDSENAQQDMAVAVIRELVEMAQWKKWLREACVDAILAVVAELSPSRFIQDVAAELAGSLLAAENVASYNADQVALAAGLQHYITRHALTDKQLPAVYVACPAMRIVRRKGMHALVAPLTNSSACYPRVHSAWMGLFGHILHVNTKKKEEEETEEAEEEMDGELLQEAWSVLVENFLLAPETATHERKALALKLLEMLVTALSRRTAVSSSLVRILLTPHLVKCLYNNTRALSSSSSSSSSTGSKKPKTVLHEAARHALRVLATQASREFYAFLQRVFLSPPSSLVAMSPQEEDEDAQARADEEKTNKDKKKKTKSKTKEEATPRGFDAIIAIEEARDQAVAVQRRVSTVRLWAIDLMAAELTTSNDAKALEQPQQQQVLAFLVFHAFFTANTEGAPVKKSKKKSSKKSKTHDDDSNTAADLLTADQRVASPPLTLAVRQGTVKRVFSLISGSLSAVTSSCTLLDSVFRLASQFLTAVPQSGNQKEAESSAVTLRVALSDEERALMQRVEMQLQTLGQTEDVAYRVLLQSCALQLLDPSQRRDARAVVADLTQCLTDLKSESKATSKKNKSKKKTEEEGREEEGKPRAVVVLTDLLLSLLSQDSSAIREIVTYVFRALVPLMTTECLQTLVRVVSPEEEEEEEEQSNGKVAKKRNDDEEDEEMEDEEDEDEMEDEEEKEEEEEVVLTSASELADALRGEDAAHVAELQREDATLSAIVGQVLDRAQLRKDVKRHRVSVLHFKLRVLELLALFASHSSSSSSPAAIASHGQNVLSLVLPLFQGLVVVASSDVEQRVLKERLQAVLLHKVVRVKELPVLSREDQRDEVLAALRSVVKLLTRKPLDRDVAQRVGGAVVVHLVRVLVTEEQTSTQVEEDVSTVLRVGVVDAFTKKHGRFPRQILDDLATRFPRVAVRALLPSLSAVAVASSDEKKEEAEEEEGTTTPSLRAVDAFSTAEVFRLLSVVLKPKHATASAAERGVLARWRAPLATALAALLTKQSQTTDKEDEDEKIKDEGKQPMRAKRLKVVVSCALQLVKAWRALDAAEAGGAKKKGKKAKDSEEKALASLVAVAAAMESSSPVIKHLAQQVTAAAAAAAAATATATATASSSSLASGKEKSAKKSKANKTKEASPKKRKRSIGTHDDDE